MLKRQMMNPIMILTLKRQVVKTEFFAKREDMNDFALLALGPAA
jgi:hypothetical protein